MGIFTQKKPPVPHDPDVLILASSAAAANSAGGQDASALCPVPDTFAVRLDRAAVAPEAGSLVYIFEHGATMGVYSPDPHLRRIGTVADAQAGEVTMACRALGSGLKAVVLGPPSPDGLLHVRVEWDD